MGLFSRFLRSAPEQRATLAEPTAELLAVFGAVPTAAGASVTPETALRSATALAAVRAISEAVGSLPVHVYRRGPDGSRERATDHPAARILSGDWTPWSGSAESRTALQVDALLYGFGIAATVEAGGEIRELHRLDPRAVSIEYDDITGEPSYRVRQAQGGDRILSYTEVLFVATPGSAPGRLLCLLDCAREAIGIDLAMAEHQARLFKNGARPSGLLKLAKPLGTEALKRLRDSWNAAHAGGPNSGRTAVLEDGVTFEQVQLTSVDLQFLELRKFITEEIARGFRIPPTLAGNLERATWRNSEEMGRQFLTYVLKPWLDGWEASLSRTLLKPEERGEYFIEFVTDDFLRADTAARFAAYRQAVGGAWMTRNEARRRDNLPPLEDGDGLLLQAGQSDEVPEEDLTNG